MAAFQQFKLPPILPDLLTLYSYDRVFAGGLMSIYAVIGLLASLGLAAGLTFAVTILITAGESEESFAAYVGHAEAANWSGFPVAMGLAIFCNEGAVGPAPPHPRLPTRTIPEPSLQA